MIKDKVVRSRITGLDFEYLRKEAERRKRTISYLLSELIERDRERAESQGAERKHK